MNKKKARLRRAANTRFKIRKQEAIRLAVHRTPKHIYAQITKSGEVVASASTVESVIKQQVEYTGNKSAALIVGKIIAERAIEKGIYRVAFDRSGYKYHGRVESLANSARENGLQF
ncbi:50S ribosomal protein L18 [Candidatus Nitrosacidococcus sp. I8]|uniref:50S ribosomal protein L18 n=1 Tax=Candidatus Nitrosacidococcus sp. I8 TaxID=2942908 RepID=UPI0022271BCF|nr:50S ribosomal protein L18 [Candidatus Nitrosacidococcus sp. I8]CAH9017346.1 50S ribosomal protein L18 [Candidatus Nitrosacidococcus sp. I8]